MWHLNGQLFKTRPTLKDLADALVKGLGTNANKVPSFLINILKLKASQVSPSAPTPTGLSRSLEAMAPAVPFLYQLFTVGQDDFLPTKLFDLNQHCHKREGNQYKHIDHSGAQCSNPNDLWSLCKPITDPNNKHKDCRNKNCGGYLDPLSHSEGATYAPDNASAYLSWLTYLTDDFHEWFQNLLDEFKKIDCSKTGCRTSSSNTKCSKPQQPGTHGSDQSCTCDSVVHCGGVLPVLYRHGFQFHSPHTLSGGNDGATKISCDMFHTALSNVLSPEAPLAKLLETIDSFLYAIRWEFFSKLSGYWTIYICLILYTFFFLLDTLHMRSHLKLTSSHILPPLALLTSGKPLPVTKLTYTTQ
ncbi:extracellular matrix-binding ebh, putative [Babesia caballi]|uniref:Extracellular matrix-binding ebh, putative n=1 Tax=Babesia caballi TaxID=5871 RepID=A0AAV4LMR1_BABCB|nr:extracellular matrix-binding ebh, putative [Babesia caballi]